LKISGMSLTLTLPHRLCLFRVLLGAFTSFPLSKHTGGGGATPIFSGQLVYLQFTWGVSLPPSPVEFSSLRHFYKLSYSWLLGGCHHSCLLPSPANVFIYSSMRDCSPQSSVLRVPHPLCYMSFVVVVVYSVCFLFLFSLHGSQSVQGAMLTWPRVVCGSIMCCLAHLVVCVSPAGEKQTTR
jgi:hypothetical protein